MITIDEFEELLDAIAEEIPQEFYDGLNGGILVNPGAPLHPESGAVPLYIMGEYHRDSAMGKYITIYYGSFSHAYGELERPALREVMRKVLLHEFRHHLEGRAGLRDLEVWDADQIAKYKKEY